MPIDPNEAQERAEKNLHRFNQIRARDFHFDESVRHLKESRKYAEGFKRKTIDATIQIVEGLRRDDLNPWFDSEEMMSMALKCWFEKKFAEKQQLEQGGGSHAN